MEQIKITDFINENLISLDLKAKTKSGVLKELANMMATSENIINKDECYDAILKRENLGSTGIGKSVAIPHAKTESASKLTLGFAINRNGINFDSLDEEPVHIFFVFASPAKDSQKYLKVLARISRIIRSEKFRTTLLNAKTPKEILKIISTEE